MFLMSPAFVAHLAGVNMKWVLLISHLLVTAAEASGSAPLANLRLRGGNYGCDVDPKDGT